MASSSSGVFHLQGDFAGNDSLPAPLKQMLAAMGGSGIIGSGGSLFGDIAAPSDVDMATGAFHGGTPGNADNQKAMNTRAGMPRVWNAMGELVHGSLVSNPDDKRHGHEEDELFSAAGNVTGPGVASLGHFLSNMGGTGFGNVGQMSPEEMKDIFGMNFTQVDSFDEDDDDEEAMWEDDVMHAHQQEHAAAGLGTRLVNPQCQMLQYGRGPASLSAAMGGTANPLAASPGSAGSARKKRKAHHLDDPPAERPRAQAGHNMANNPAESFDYVTNFISMPDVQRIFENVGIYDFCEGKGESPNDGDLLRLRYKAWARPSNTVVADYTSWPPFSFKLGSGDVVKGLDIGVRGMKISGKRQLVIPDVLGYGDEQVGLVPPKSSLVMVVILDAIVKPKGSTGRGGTGRRDLTSLR